MASADAVNRPPPSSSLARGGIRAEDLNRIDITSLSQSELQALSLCSASAFDVRRTDDVVCPQLDRSVFNESAGSRRQTYSGIHHRSHSRLPRLHPSLQPHTSPHPSSDPVTHSIVHFLKHYLNGNHNPPHPPPPPAPQESPNPPVADVGVVGLQENLKFKRKRGRKSRDLTKAMLLENGVGTELQRVNGKGEMVNFAELEKNGDELYGNELKRRTAGMETEEGILGFLRDLEGQWCSRRKKRKYVDAATFGDVLPIGWKLLLGLRRRDYRVSVYCRRYISPTGQQFLSCKEAASFLRFYFGDNDANQQRDQRTSSIQQAYTLSSELGACPADKTDDMSHAIVAHSALAKNSSNSNENEDCSLGIENLPEVQVRDIFECVKCKLTFDEKDVYLQHLFSFHQKTTKRYKLGTPVGEGVIIKDGKYECQFCHKIFEERRSYNGHVGSHVRNTGRSSSELAAPVYATMQEKVTLRPSTMDALTEITHDSKFETSADVTSDKAITDDSAVVLRIEEAQAANSHHEEKSTSDPVRIQAEDCVAGKTLLEDSNHGSQAMAEDDDIQKDAKARSVNIKMDPTCISDSVPAQACEVQKYESSSLEVDHDNGSLKTSEDHIQDKPGLTVEEIMFEGVVSSLPLTQSFQFFPPFDSVSNKGEHEFSVVDQKLENVTGFEELGFDDMEPFSFGGGQELSSLPGGSINLDSNSGLDNGFDSPVRFGAEEIMLNPLHLNQLTVCVWCRTEFRLEGIESETLSDSIGYMCPTCKANISGHFDGGL